MAVKHKIKTPKGIETKTLTGMSAIRQKCLDCSCWQPKEVRECPIKYCSLYPFRFGKYPKKSLVG